MPHDQSEEVDGLCGVAPADRNQIAVVPVLRQTVLDRVLECVEYSVLQLYQDALDLIVTSKICYFKPN